MSTLEKLVPPLELCKQIPKGAFEDSALVWWLEAKSVRHGEIWCVTHREACVEGEIWFPAPTLAEILEALPTSISESKEKFYLYLLDTRNKPENDWQVGYAHEAFYGLYCSKKRKARDTTPATAALKLFLGMEARR